MGTLFDDIPEPGDAHDKAKAHARRALPRRFYSAVTVDEGGDGSFGVLLDGKPVRTPAKAYLRVPSRGLAETLAGEWDAQNEEIDPAQMPLTRIVNSIVDAVAADPGPVRAEIVKFAGSDLVCYRAETPESLVAAQGEAWDPVLAFAERRLGARFVLAGGIMHVAQPHEALDAVASAVDPFDVYRLAALHVVTTITGSALIALALAHGEIDAEAAFLAAHVDEDWNARFWGSVPEAEAQREMRRRDLMAAALVLADRDLAEQHPIGGGESA